MIKVEVFKTLNAIAPDAWDDCADPAPRAHRPKDPFATHRFLYALEQSGSVGEGTGWDPFYLSARHEGALVGVAPLYAKYHSQGEYIFDHSWAHAYERAGGQYYPKLQIAIPFTPATGRRLLVKPGNQEAAQRGLIEAAQNIASQNSLSTLHVTFCTAQEADAGQALGLMRRETQQFHWQNADYGDFEDFLQSLSSRKRKSLRKERAQAQGFGGQIYQHSGAAITPAHWDAFWRFYQDTGARKWGRPYLTRAFFDLAQEHLSDDILMLTAECDGEIIAGALNFIGSDTLFGRYWGCAAHHPCLHFELCYYQAIDYAIAHGLKFVEAGAQGEHKLARGYLPRKTYSLHWALDAGFSRAIAQYLDAERRANNQEIEILTEYGPFRKAPQQGEQQ